MNFVSVIDCIATEHDPALLALAAGICVTGCYTTFALLRTADGKSAASRVRWLALAGVAAGAGVWSTHFIAMLAFDTGRTIGFELGFTLLSLAVALAAPTAACLLIPTSRGPRDHAVIGAAVGLGVAAMHYTGMAGFEFGGHVEWDAAQAVTAIVVGAGFSAAAFASLLRDRYPRTIATLLLTLGICSLHFTGMSAMTLVPDPTVVVDTTVTPAVLALWVATGCTVMLALGLGCIWRDVRDRLRRKSERERLDSFADIAMEGLLICDGEAIVSANRAFETLSGFKRETLATRRLGDLLPQFTAAPDDANGRASELMLMTASGEAIPVEVLVGPVMYDGLARQTLAIRDLRARRKADAKLRWLATHDSLTSLPNRLRLTERLDELAAAGMPSAVLLIDLDRFKSVNDTLGHGVGDRLLKRVADRLGNIVRKSDLLARLGGDEFAVLRSGRDAALGTDALATELIDMLERPFLIDGHIINIGASIGIATAENGTFDSSQIVKNADLALYDAKRSGGCLYRHFHERLEEEALIKRNLELDLRRGIARHEFELLYQPKLDLASNRVVGFEALLRWNHPERGVISPLEFIPLAEETGLISQIGSWAVREACIAARQWPDHVSVAVNLSPVQFQRSKLVPIVGAALRDSGLAPERLELEITENHLLFAGEESLATLAALRHLGVKLSMDDFGTGYSALGYLRKFRFDRIKIDRSFMIGIDQNEDSSALVHAIIDMAHALGIHTTAEGVETVEQLELMRTRGCDEIQGYLISRPIPQAETLKFVRTFHRNAA